MQDKNNGKAKIQTSDFLLLLGVITVICALLFRTPIENAVSGLFESVKVRYDVVIYDTDIDYTPLIHENDVFYDADGNSLGTVILASGNAYSNEISVETYGKADKMGTYIGDHMFVAAGKELSIITSENVKFVCTVKNVEIIPQ